MHYNRLASHIKWHGHLHLPAVSIGRRPTAPFEVFVIIQAHLPVLASSLNPSCVEQVVVVVVVPVHWLEQVSLDCPFPQIGI